MCHILGQWRAVAVWFVLCAPPQQLTTRAIMALVSGQLHRRCFPKVELRPPVLDLSNGWLRDAAERQIKCWGRPAILEAGAISVVS